jgi:hypothetical protein
MSNTLIYTLKDESVYKTQRYPTDPPPLYDLDILTIACSFEQSRLVQDFDDFRLLRKGNYSGYAGHVMLTYRQSQGRLLVSNGHWIELSHIDLDEAHAVLVLQQQFGDDYARQVRLDLGSTSNEEERQQVLQQSVRQLIQSTVPCAYSFSLRSPRK